MTTVAGNHIETREIGLPFGLSGRHSNTRINEETGFLQLTEIDYDGKGKPVYSDEGYWESDPIDFAEKFTDYDKVFITSTHVASDTYSVQTRVSDDTLTWSDWTPIAEDGTIQSETKRYIQVRIVLYAGFVEDLFIINKDGFKAENPYVETEILSQANYLIPALGNSTHYSVAHGVVFANSVLNGDTETSANAKYRAFDRKDNTYWTSGGTSGVIGFLFNNPTKATGYVLGCFNTLQAPKDWALQASKNTTTGFDGNWVVLDRNSQIWSNGLVLEIPLENEEEYIAYRIVNTSSPNPLVGVTHFNLLSTDKELLKLKKEYNQEMLPEEDWVDEGMLYRKKINSTEWFLLEGLKTSQVFTEKE